MSHGSHFGALNIEYGDPVTHYSFVMPKEVFTEFMRVYKGYGYFRNRGSIARMMKDMSAWSSALKIVTPVSSGGQSGSISKEKCSYCHQTGHMSNDCAEMNSIKCWWCRSKEHDFFHCPVVKKHNPGINLQEEEQIYLRERRVQDRVEYIKWYAVRGMCFQCKTDQHTYETCSEVWKHEIFSNAPSDACYICERPDHVMSVCPKSVHLSVETPTYRESTCSKCGRKGHTQEYCKDRGCFLCKGFGHKMRDCPSRNLKSLGDQLDEIGWGAESSSSAAVAPVAQGDITEPQATSTDVPMEPSKDAVAEEEEDVGHTKHSSGESEQITYTAPVHVSQPSVPEESTIETNLPSSEIVPESTSGQLILSFGESRATVDASVENVCEVLGRLHSVPCRMCGETGHYHRNCPQFLKRRRLGESNPINPLGRASSLGKLPSSGSVVSINRPEISEGIKRAADDQSVEYTTTDAIADRPTTPEIKRSKIEEHAFPPAPPSVHVSVDMSLLPPVPQTSESAPTVSHGDTAVSSAGHRDVNIGTVSAAASGVITTPRTQLPWSAATVVSSTGQTERVAQPATAVSSAGHGEQTGSSGSGVRETIRLATAIDLPGGPTYAPPMIQDEHLTPEEAAPIKLKFEQDTHKCIAHVASAYQNEHKWEVCRMELDRVERWRRIFHEHEGHLAIRDELQELVRDADVQPPRQIIEMIVSALRGGMNDPSEESIKLYLNHYGWARLDHMLEFMKHVYPMDINLNRIFCTVLHDPQRRLEIWMSDTAGSGDTAVSSAGHHGDTAVSSAGHPRSLPTHVRASYGHRPSTGIRAKDLFGKWQTFDPTSANDSYGGPEYIFHYTTPNAMTGIATARELIPGGNRAEKPTLFVYCCPVGPTSGYTVPGCHRNKNQSICIVLDFKLMLKDGIRAFYAGDGTVCVEGPIQDGYFVHVYSLQYGETWFFRSFHVNFDHRRSECWNLESRRRMRHLNTECCFICGGTNFVGFHICFHCTRPFFYPDHLPEWDQYAVNWRDMYIVQLTNFEYELHKQLLFEARMVKSQIVYAVFNVKPPPQDVLDKRSSHTKGKPSTIASTFDKSQDRKLRSLVKQGVAQHPDVMDRITRHAPYRTTLANYLINVDCYYNPAQYLLSKYCKAALKLARELGEMPEATPPPPIRLPEFPDL